MAVTSVRPATGAPAPVASTGSSQDPPPTQLITTTTSGPQSTLTAESTPPVAAAPTFPPAVDEQFLNASDIETALGTSGLVARSEPSHGDGAVTDPTESIPESALLMPCGTKIPPAIYPTYLYLRGQGANTATKTFDQDTGPTSGTTQANVDVQQHTSVTEIVGPIKPGVTDLFRLIATDANIASCPAHGRDPGDPEATGTSHYLNTASNTVVAFRSTTIIPAGPTRTVLTDPSSPTDPLSPMRRDFILVFLEGPSTAAGIEISLNAQPSMSDAQILALVQLAAHKLP